MREQGESMTNESYVKLGWVKGKVIEKHKGFTEGALHKMRAAGKIAEGICWKRWNGVILYNFEALEEHFDAS